MNLVPKNPIESALVETLAGVDAPAWVIDVGRGLVAGANGRGHAVWGIPTMSPMLESVIPALTTLAREFARGDVSESDAGALAPLKFWTGTRVRTVLCEVRPLDEHVGPGLLQVVAGAAHEPSRGQKDQRPRGSPTSSAALRTKAAPVVREEAPRPRAPQTAAPSPQLNDLETLREIARRIRQGSARLSAGAELPANEDGAPEVRAPAPEPPRDDQVSEQHAHLAHEIRTPLAAIVSLAEVITEERLGPWPNDRYRAYVRDILESARHGLEVVDGILRDKPSQPGATRVFAEVDLNAEVDAINTSLQPLAGKSGARLEAALVGGLPRVIADRRNVRQMLLNLISNSIKHGGPSVRIKVTTGYELSGEVWVEVEDNGPGMPSSVEKGASATAPPRTTGLGLPLTRSLAGANGARLDIRSRAGRGVRARLVFSGDRSAAR